MKADPDQRRYYIRVAMGKRRADRDRVCTKAVVERGDVESPRKGPLVVKSVEVMKQNSNVGYLKFILGVWRFLILAHFEDMDMAFTEGIMDLQF